MQKIVYGGAGERVAVALRECGIGFYISVVDFLELGGEGGEELGRDVLARTSFSWDDTILGGRRRHFYIDEVCEIFGIAVWAFIVCLAFH